MRTTIAAAIILLAFGCQQVEPQIIHIHRTSFLPFQAGEIGVFVPESPWGGKPDLDITPPFIEVRKEVLGYRNYLHVSGGHIYGLETHQWRDWAIEAAQLLARRLEGER